MPRRHAVTVASLLSALILAAACGPRTGRSRVASAGEVAVPPAAATHVDSLVPRDTAIARFQATAKPVSALTNGYRSRDALVKAYARAIATRDTLTLARMAITRDEFAFLYYPTTPQGLPPYDLAPALMWFMLQQNSRKGLLHTLEERRTQLAHYRGHECPDSASHEGPNTVWGPCLVAYEQAPGDVVKERLFSQVIERDGKYKMLNFSNKL
jgi:hypothetical protein